MEIPWKYFQKVRFKLNLIRIAIVFLFEYRKNYSYKHFKEIFIILIINEVGLVQILLMDITAGYIIT